MGKKPVQEATHAEGIHQRKRKAEEKSHATHSMEQMKESSFSKHLRALQDKMFLEKIHSRQLYESLAFWFFPRDFFL